jgi:hypothetical protein
MLLHSTRCNRWAEAILLAQRDTADDRAARCCANALCIKNQTRAG